MVFLNPLGMGGWRKGGETRTWRIGSMRGWGGTEVIFYQYKSLGVDLNLSFPLLQLLLPSGKATVTAAVKTPNPLISTGSQDSGLLPPTVTQQPPTTPVLKNVGTSFIQSVLSMLYQFSPSFSSSILLSLYSFFIHFFHLSSIHIPTTTIVISI